MTAPTGRGVTIGGIASAFQKTRNLAPCTTSSAGFGITIGGIASALHKIRNLAPCTPPPGTFQDLVQTPTEIPPPLSISALQSQLDIATRINSSMQQTIAQQNQDIQMLTTQAKELQTTIDSLNGSIALLRTQVAILSDLQTQIASLEKEIAALRLSLNQILALI
jgi:hypothetical protein